MNLAQDALHVLQTVAPTIARATLGPFGGLAATAISAILGTPPGDEQATNAALLAATPDQLLALKKAEQDFTVQMKTLGIAEEKLSFDDVANARALETATRSSTPDVLTYLTTAGFFVALIGGFVMAIPEASKGIVFSMIGSLGTVWITQMGFYFGSSLGSHAKDSTISSLVATK
jgi:hypothetical protein